MGKMENRSKEIGRRTKIRDALMLTLYGAGMLTLAVLAPNTVQLLKKFDPDMQKKRRADYRIREALHRLEKRGFVRKGAKGFELTGSGEKYATRLRLMRQAEPRWDGKWRLVTFDVWERRRRVRNRLRQLLVEKGFIRLQDSVWVYPYPCEDFIVLLRAELKLGGALVYVIAESIDIEKQLKRDFGLPS